ncbi:MAG: hypothetical protein ACRYFA_12115 [Janthinobacterium lividum]
MTRNLKLLILIILLIAFAFNSCKKESTSSLTTFLTQRPWKMALLQRFAYVNNVLVKTDTLQSTCALTQTLTFKKDNNYTYQNYVCTNSTINKPWSFTADYLYLNLNSDITINSLKMQSPARIITLGQYSLVFDAGDINTTYTKTDSVIIFRYGFVH